MARSRGVLDFRSQVLAEASGESLESIGLKSAGARMGLSESRASQIHTAALARLRRVLKISAARADGCPRAGP